MSSSQPRAHVDLSALVHNYREVERLVGPCVAILAMVKADAYGHGAIPVSQALARAGCRVFGVATLAEAVEVRDAVAGVGARVVVFGGLDASDAEQAVACGAEIVTQERDVVEALGASASAAGCEVAVHVKVDTGMRRLGIEVADAPEFVRLIDRVAGVKPVALCSHFAMAESVTTEVTGGQLERLEQAAQAVANTIRELPCHLANSAAILTRPHAHLDMVRPGLMLYGLYPDPGLAGHAALEPVMTLEARVVRVAQVGPGEGIGYGHTYRTTAPRVIATVRCGYADGYPRAMSNRGVALVEGCRVPVVGRVCMDQIMIDVSDVEGVALGTPVVLWGRGLDAGEAAELADTISYELVARVGPRVERVYTEES